MSFRVQRLIGLCHMIIVFFIRSHVNHFVCDHRILRIGLVNDTIRSLHEAVLIDPCIACKRVDQSDVGSFRRLNGAHPSIMGVMYVTDLESGTLTGQTARSQRGQTSLMGQLTQRVVLIHELGQLGGTEELLYRGCHRLDIDQRLG